MIKKTYYIFTDHDDCDETAIFVFYGDVTKEDIQRKVDRFIVEWHQFVNEGVSKADSSYVGLERYVMNKLSACYAVDIITDFDVIWF